MSSALIILPNQLFAEHPGLSEKPNQVVLIEEPLFFGDPVYPANFHKQKLWLHRATMRRYETRLRNQGFNVSYVAYKKDAKLLRDTVADLQARGCNKLFCLDPVDFTAKKRLETAAAASDLQINILPTPGFINWAKDNNTWAQGRKRWFMAEFYKYQRKRLDVLMDGDEPKGGQWSFDEENRKKIPKKMLFDIPDVPPVSRDQFDQKALASVEADFPDALGRIETLIYPTSHEEAAKWLDRFLNDRFHLFGDYEDAIVEGESWLWHSVLTPMLNIGLLTPQQVLEDTLDHAERFDVPINSLEGFVRQIIGWREFMRATYEDLGVRMRTTNHWKHRRRMPESFYGGTTGIDPFDDVIQRLLETGYCHHIERLMVLGGFMFLCEIDPDDVYRWFMEMFIDSYDWVMVPNVYAMSQNADGGLITTKPYFSGSNYVCKMSHWQKGPWAETWDGLYWRFIEKHRESLVRNPRWAMMCRTAERMAPEKMQAHLDNAEAFL
ncbi:MAG: cryptochrome/photolyase family protein, partial [Pseudomonadota bacterium]